jgi:hypothetical protein
VKFKNSEYSIARNKRPRVRKKIPPDDANNDMTNAQAVGTDREHKEDSSIQLYNLRPDWMIKQRVRSVGKQEIIKFIVRNSKVNVRKLLQTIAMQILLKMDA